MPDAQLGEYGLSQGWKHILQSYRTASDEMDIEDTPLLPPQAPGCFHCRG
ncbi:hypothetical protein PL9631_910022 [Planktothrix paucivesiculata PCC 9631]|uniref:Uncharacterized protein n=1 Tax=Planktothrix paucivesiculata PCC 9631 TaxID=671071 RepID=A0A7Z9C112_9CYAN|nr:hypothetical protein PL9631_910022 [Planktothrix paucivesiculata PCC 9631]